MANQLMRAVRLAKRGITPSTPSERVSVNDHDFNVKKAKVVRNGDTSTITGQLSHHLTWRTDDQVYYTIIKQDGVVQNIEFTIQRGGASAIPGFKPIAAAISTYILGVPVSPDNIRVVAQTLGSFTSDNWEEAAERIIATISLYLN